MPASSDLVSLDHAKDWAKRLLKHGDIARTLSQAQAAVAVMLGHASWHALSSYYKGLPAPSSAASTVMPAAPTSTPVSPEDGMVALCAAINQQHPELKAARVVEMAHELDLLDEMAETMADDIQRRERDGEFLFEAAQDAIKAHTVNIKSPPGHLMIRVEKQDGTFVLVLVTSEMFGKALGFPTPPSASPAAKPAQSVKARRR